MPSSTVALRAKTAERVLLESYGRAWAGIRKEIILLVKQYQEDVPRKELRNGIEIIGGRITVAVRPIFREAAQIVIQAQSEAGESTGEVDRIGITGDGRTATETMDAIGFSLVQAVKMELDSCAKEKRAESPTLQAIRRLFAMALDKVLTTMSAELPDSLEPSQRPETADSSLYAKRVELRPVPVTSAGAQVLIEGARAKYGRTREERAKSLESWFGPDDIEDVNG